MASGRSITGARAATLTPAAGVLVACLAGVVAAAPLAAAETVELRGAVDRIAADAATITGFESTLTLTASGVRGDFRIARVELIESGRALDDVRVTCAALELTNRRVRCREAQFAMTLPIIGRQTTAGAFHYDRKAGRASVMLAALSVAGGRVRLDLAAADGGIEARYAGTALQLGGMLDVAGEFGAAPDGFAADGRVDVAGTLSAPAGRPPRIVLTAALSGASVSNAAGTIATDGVHASVELDATVRRGETTLTLRFDSDRGEAYVEPVYANFAEHRVELVAEDVVTRDFSSFNVGRFRVQQESLLDASGSLTLARPPAGDAPPAITADIELHDASVANLYTNLLRVLAAGTLFGDLQTDGRVSGEIRVVDGSPASAALRLADVILDDRRGRFAIFGLRGQVNWRADGSRDALPSHFGWDSGMAYDIIVGGGAFDVRLGGRDVELLSPLRLPIMGGALRINDFAVRDFGGDGATGRLDAELEPIQLGQLTGAFGWPAFSGTLSGSLPLLTLVENTVSVGGTLSARAFDGTVEVANLRVARPFSRVPRVRGDVTLRNLDLQRVTEAFSFGLIQGRLSGDVTGLEMLGWRPVAMDMHLYTPDDDRSRHRISQRAVENLASVGGSGAAAALSSGFLQFFEVFAYDRIGLRCVLSNGVCAMSGVAPASADAGGQGYYIVKGSGIPRIDVVGYRDTVSWPRLVRQLAAITRSGSPTVR